MNLEFEAPLGQRTHRYFMGILVLMNEEDNEGLWWCRDRRIWTRLEDNRGGLSSHAPCRTLRAFKRHLRKHRAALAGKWVCLVNRFMDHDVFAEVAK